MTKQERSEYRKLCRLFKSGRIFQHQLDRLNELDKLNRADLEAKRVAERNQPRGADHDGNWGW